MVDVFYDPSSVMPDPKMQPLMQLMLQNKASKEEIKEFGTLWQERVKKIIVENMESVVRVRRV